MDGKRMVAVYRRGVANPWMLGYGFGRLCYVNGLVYLYGSGELSAVLVLLFLATGVPSAMAPALVSPRILNRSLLRRVFWVASVAANACGLLGVAAGLAMDASFLACLGAVLLGVGMPLMGVLWGEALSRCDEGGVAYGLVGSMVVAALISLAANLAGLPPLFTCVAFLVLSMATLAALTRELDATERNECGSTGSDEGREGPAVAIGFTEIEYSPTLVVSVCALLFAFCFAYHAAVQMLFVGHVSFPLQYLEDVIAPALLIVVFMSCSRVGIITLCRVCLPLLAFAYLAGGFVSPEMLPLFAVVAGVSTKVAQPFMWLVIIKAVHGNPQKAWFAIGFQQVAMRLGHIAALLFAGFLNPALLPGGPMYVGLVLVIFVTLVIFAILPHGRGGDGFSAPEGAHAPFDADASCAALAASCGLTARETDVLRLATTGMTQSQMADRLCVGEGTVHAHLVHIYAKLGVHSKSELMALVYDSAKNSR